MEENFEKLEELIKDDDKIVSLASFAVEADISIEKSKEIIEKYVEINKGSGLVNTTYVLNGKKKGEDRVSISLVKDDALENEKALYEEGVKQIIFSIQKAKNIDFNIIALVDPLSGSTDKDRISGLIVGKNCLKRVLRKKVLPTLPPATVKGKSTIFTKQNSAVKSENTKIEKDDGDSNQNNKNKGSTQGNIASLFSKAAQNKKSEPKDTKQQEKKQKTNGGLSNFFTKQPSKNLGTNENHKKQNQKEIKSESKDLKDNGEEKNRQDKKEDLCDSATDDEILNDLEIKKEEKFADIKEQSKISPKKKQGKKSDLFDSDTEDEILKDLEIKEENLSEKKSEKKKEPAKTTQRKSKSSQKKKRGKGDVGNDKSVKKRKRIIVEDDSDSDDIFGSEKSDSEEDVIEKSDEEAEPAKVEKKPLAPKNKRRKAVEKIYEDEEGYIVTKVDYVYETPSEDENEPEKKIAKVEEKPKPKIEKKGSSNSENDISPNKGAKSKKAALKKAPSGNQPTLMNFFKKK